MMNNFSCDQLHLDILTSSTQSSLNNHIADEVVHVKEADHTNINKIPDIESSISTLNTTVSDIQSNIDNAGYVTNDELVAKDYITKSAVKDLYVQKSLIDEKYASKDYVDEKISGLDIEGTAPNIQINATTDSTAVHVDVIKQSTGSDKQQDFKFKFTGFDNITGSGSGDSYTIVTIYRTSDSNTTAPSINKASSSIPTYWSTSIVGAEKYLWRSQGRVSKDGSYLQYADFTYWSTPECCGIINGETSDVGVDTDTIDYVYWATNDDIKILAPQFTVEQAKSAFESSDYITDNGGGRTRSWYNHPTGVSSDKVYEYCSYALYDSKNQIWGNYSTPFIFSHYGVNGKDGDGIEYIYCLNTTNNAPEISYSGFTEDDIQQDDFVPGGGWSDDPQSVDEVNQYQFVAIRKKDGSTGRWGTFSTPALWSVYVKPRDPDDPADVESQITYYKYGKKDEEMIDITERYEQQVPDGWYSLPTGNPTDEDYLYMITSKTINGVTVPDEDGYYWSEAARITGVPGPPGTSATGVDGSDINYIYARTKLTTVPTKPTFTVDDLEDYPGQYDQEDSTYGTLTWYDHPQGITEEYKYEWAAIAKKPAGTKEKPSQDWGSYNTPILWSSYGKEGRDGDGVEYIYTRRAEENVPETPTAKYGDNRDDDIPDGWTDDPSGVTEDYRYEYVSVRKQKDGIWQAYSAAALWARYSKDGDKGDPGIDGVSLMINTRRWDKCNIGDTFYKGDSGDPQVDVVYYNGKYYRCIKTFTLTEKATQAPTVKEFWSEFESYSNIATELFLADEASIENLLLNQAKAKNSSTGEVTVSIDGDTGKLVAKDVEIEGTIEGVVRAVSISYSVVRITYNQSRGWHNIPFNTVDGDNINEENPEIAAEVLMLSSKYTVFTINPNCDDIDNIDGEQLGTRAVVLGIPSAKKVGQRSIDIYFDDFADRENLLPYSTDNNTTYKRPKYRWFIATCDVTGTPNEKEGLLVPTSNCSVNIKASSSPNNEYKIQDILRKYVTFGNRDYVETVSYSSVSSITPILDILAVPGDYGYIRILPRACEKSTSGKFYYETPSHIRLMSDGKTWYLIDYDY